MTEYNNDTVVIIIIIIIIIMMMIVRFWHLAASIYIWYT